MGRFDRVLDLITQRWGCKMIIKILEKIKRRARSRNQTPTTSDFNEETALHGFKVLWERYSCLTDGHPCVEYSSKYWTVPQRKCGPLTVFDDFFAAYRFTHDHHNIRPYRKPYGNFAIVPCSYIPSTETSVWRPGDIDSEPSTRQRQLETMPKGTVLADAVTLDPYRPPGIYLGPWESPYVFIDPIDCSTSWFEDKNPYLKFCRKNPSRGECVPRKRRSKTLDVLGV